MEGSVAYVTPATDQDTRRASVHKKKPRARNLGNHALNAEIVNSAVEAKLGIRRGAAQQSGVETFTREAIARNPGEQHMLTWKHCWVAKL